MSLEFIKVSLSGCLTEGDKTLLGSSRSDSSPTQLSNMCWIISDSPGETTLAAAWESRPNCDTRGSFFRSVYIKGILMLQTSF